MAHYCAGERCYEHAGCSLAELSDDPLIGFVTESDGVERRELELLLERAARAESAGAPIYRTPVNHHDNKPAVDPDRSWSRNRATASQP